MLLTQLKVTAALATLTQAFLLPPTITTADKDIIKTLPFDDAVAIDSRTMEIDCPGCPVWIKDIQGTVHSAEVESILRLNFSLSHDEIDQLMLNGLPIYPLDFQSEAFMRPLFADQLVKAGEDAWQYSGTYQLGYSLSVYHPAKSSNNEQLDLTALHLEILEVADKFVDGIPSIDLKLLETPSGKLMIGDAEIVLAKSPASAPTDDGKQECTTMICKWRAIIADKLSQIKGCVGKKAARPGVHGSGHGNGVRPHGYGRPRPHSGPHPPHRYHHRHGGFARFLRSIFLHVFIPIMIGVVVGVTTSLVGMVVGHLIVFIWRALFRRGQRGQYAKVAQQEEAVMEEVDEEMKSFLEHQSPPPVYEEAPEYEEPVAKEKASE